MFKNGTSPVSWHISRAYIREDWVSGACKTELEGIRPTTPYSDLFSAFLSSSQMCQQHHIVVRACLFSGSPPLEPFFGSFITARYNCPLRLSSIDFNIPILNTASVRVDTWRQNNNLFSGSCRAWWISVSRALNFLPDPRLKSNSYVRATELRWLMSCDIMFDSCQCLLW